MAVPKSDRRLRAARARPRLCARFRCASRASRSGRSSRTVRWRATCTMPLWARGAAAGRAAPVPSLRGRPPSPADAPRGAHVALCTGPPCGRVHRGGAVPRCERHSCVLDRRCGRGAGADLGPPGVWRHEPDGPRTRQESPLHREARPAPPGQLRRNVECRRATVAGRRSGVGPIGAADDEGRWAVQVVCEGLPYRKRDPKTGAFRDAYGNEVQGLDLGPPPWRRWARPRRVLSRLPPRAAGPRSPRRLQCHVDRQRRANNPHFYDDPGRVKPEAYPVPRSPPAPNRVPAARSVAP